jgi:hypothetical protein
VSAQLICLHCGESFDLHVVSGDKRWCRGTGRSFDCDQEPARHEFQVYTVRLDPNLYPEHVECPHCHGRKKVVFRQHSTEGWRAHVEEHDLAFVQCTTNARKACDIRYACPASLAIVSPWEDVR